MGRYFAWMVRQKRREADWWDRRPWVMLLVSIINALVNRSLPVYLKNQKIKALEEEVQRLRHQFVTRRQPSARSGFPQRF